MDQVIIEEARVSRGCIWMAAKLLVIITEEAGASGVIKEEARASKGYAHGRPQSYQK